MNYRKILLAPVLTEKAVSEKEKGNKYTFKIVRNATKGQVKEAVEKLYGVTVENVNVLKNGGKMKRSLTKSRNSYITSDTKKAIVQLKSGDSLKFYEGGSAK